MSRSSAFIAALASLSTRRERSESSSTSGLKLRLNGLTTEISECASFPFLYQRTAATANSRTDA